MGRTTDEFNERVEAVMNRRADEYGLKLLMAETPAEMGRITAEFVLDAQYEASQD